MRRDIPVVNPGLLGRGDCPPPFYGETLARSAPCRGADRYGFSTDQIGDGFKFDGLGFADEFAWQTDILRRAQIREVV